MAQRASLLASVVVMAAPARASAWRLTRRQPAAGNGRQAGTIGTRREKPGKPRTKAVVPFEMLPTNHMLVEARINDKGPFRLIFDLGAPITLLNNRASEASGVVKPNAPRSFLFGMRGEAEVSRLKVGELTAEKLPVIVLDHPVLTALEDVTGRRIDGIMGFTFFARFKTTIDYHAHEMTFEPIDLSGPRPDQGATGPLDGPQGRAAPRAGAVGTLGTAAGRADRRARDRRACRS